MPRPAPNSAKLDRAGELYLSGQTFKQAATEVGLHPESVRKFLKLRGIKARPRTGRPSPRRIDPPVDIADIYLVGVAEKVIAERYGVARTVVVRWLREAGVKRRTVQEANALMASKRTTAENHANLEAAHAAVTGSQQSEEHRAKIAATKERIQYGGRRSKGTEFFCAELERRGIEHQREKAVGRYNVDVALSTYPVAVEILGGNWHGTKTVHAERTPYILDRGWHLVFVWDIKRIKISADAVDEAIRLAQQSSVNPPSVGQYWVVRGDGKLLAAGQADDDQFPLVVPSIRGLS